jgi:uncharacterized protein YjbI with pentapeptide repeats
MQLMLILIALCLFCLLTLGAPDVNLVSTDAKISMPVVNTEVSYSGFLLFGPLTLIGLTFYLHVFFERLFYLPPASGQYPLPFLFNMPGRGAHFLSTFILYWMVPSILALFTWKALPRAEAPLLVVLTSAMTAILLGLQIRRFPRPGGTLASLRAQIAIATLWILWAMALAMLILQLALLLRSQLQQPTDTLMPESSEPVLPLKRPSASSAMFLPTRPLQLYNAQLNNKNLTGLNLRAANLRKAILKESDLEGAILAYADLRRADLSGANLTGVDLYKGDLRGAVLSKANLTRANLREVQTDDETDLDVKWKIVLGIVHTKGQVKQSLMWTDLRGADLHEVDLRQVNLQGADLRGADLRRANLAAADLRLADLRRTDLRQATLDGVNFDGAIIPDKFDGAIIPDKKVAKQALVTAISSLTSETCLGSPDLLQEQKVSLDEEKPHKQIPPRMYNCTDSSPNKHWRVTRTEGGEIIFQSAEEPFCLDSDKVVRNGVQPHMWKCNRDYPTQYWVVELVGADHVLIRLRDTKEFCLDSTGAKGPGVIPHLWQCDRSNHYQHWKLSFAQ